MIAAPGSKLSKPNDADAADAYEVDVFDSVLHQP